MKRLTYVAKNANLLASAGDVSQQLDLLAAQSPVSGTGDSLTRTSDGTHDRSRLTPYNGIVGMKPCAHFVSRCIGVTRLLNARHILL